jgi:hypothetical protein
MNSKNVKNIRAESTFCRPETMTFIKNGSKGENVEVGSSLNE